MIFGQLPGDAHADRLTRLPVELDWAGISPACGILQSLDVVEHVAFAWSSPGFVDSYGLAGCSLRKTLSRS